MSSPGTSYKGARRCPDEGSRQDLCSSGGLSSLFVELTDEPKIHMPPTKDFELASSSSPATSRTTSVPGIPLSAVEESVQSENASEYVAQSYPRSDAGTCLPHDDAVGRCDEIKSDQESSHRDEISPGDRPALVDVLPDASLQEQFPKQWRSYSLLRTSAFSIVSARASS